jgi:hypothetical protein
MTTTQAGLSPELIFEADGHVSELGLTCVADGEIELVPQAALDHLDGCEACGARLGEAALRSVEAGEALRQAALTPAALALGPVVAELPPGPCATALAPVSTAPLSPRRLRRPLPVAAIAAALLVAVLTAGPALADAVSALPSYLAAAFGWLPMLARVARALLVSGPAALGPYALALKSGSAVFFVLAGFTVARAATRRRAAMVEGGGR